MGEPKVSGSAAASPELRLRPAVGGRSQWPKAVGRGLRAADHSLPTGDRGTNAVDTAQKLDAGDSLVVFSGRNRF